MKKLVVANWKLNPDSLRKAESLARSSDEKNVIICAPFVYLPALKKVLKKAKIGAQDAFWANEGPYTGEVSPAQLKDLDVGYVIVGHSERRNVLQESDEVINGKVETALEAGLEVILCVGEDLETHKRGGDKPQLFVKEQLRRDLKNISAKNLKRLIVAYEPVWAISTSGTNMQDTPEEAGKIIDYIKSFLAEEYKLPKALVFYGGSVNAQSARGFINHPSMDGFIIGGASLKPAEFSKIIAVE